MSDTRYIYDYKTHKAALYQVDKYLYAMGGTKPIHWLDKAYGYSYENQIPTLWIDGKYIYGLKPDGTAAGNEPIYYYAD
ncbi:hypothetical protein [Rhizobium mesoamericanum]|uniref:Uncharacterized protein n=1 Tax=Rhizobium mesoamericanum STM3625 TaxID=1211777 RepID=K0PR31_9HYPH|nr:hypothetical protein [Rhizobium mesoamericanum]CCM76268.1 hypothetical protein BN77_0059 [Rhizobium mesoamericanum STM3625]